MPKTPIKMKDSLDRFYTKDDVAKMCIDLLLPYCHPDDLFVEPSAGVGAFFSKLPNNKIGVDLHPAMEGIIEHDWLTFNVPENCVVVGNPPFGTRNKLTKAFISHSIHKAKIVAFVLPAVFKKETMQSVFPSDWMLVSETQLPDNSFTLDGEDYHVPCVFQIWIKKVQSCVFTDLRESVKVKVETQDFTFSKKEDSDFFVFGASPSNILAKELVSSNNRGYYIKQHSDDVVETFKKIDWKSKGKSSVSGGVAWFPKQEIINIYEEFKNDHTNKDS